MPLQTSGSVKFVKAANDLPSTERSIFRAEALEHYAQNQEKVALPPLVSPRAFVFLWVVAALILIAGLVLVFSPWVEQWMVST